MVVMHTCDNPACCNPLHLRLGTTADNVADKWAKGRGKGGRAARLVVIEPRQRRGLTFGLTGELTLGRDPTCAISIDDDTYVSSLHLRFYDVEGQPMVEDLGSTNGTFVNGNKLIGSKLLHPGDRVQVGTTVIEAQ